VRPDLDAATRWSADVDRRARDGVVATTGDGEIVGRAAWARLDATRAEVAFEVADAAQLNQGKAARGVLLGSRPAR
jgi:hypothetical protein